METTRWTPAEIQTQRARHGARSVREHGRVVLLEEADRGEDVPAQDRLADLAARAHLQPQTTDPPGSCLDRGKLAG